jgi:hypothetical protein
VLAAVLLCSAAFSINFCATLFQCGCDFFWTTSDAHCNIHHRTGPHCPWCAHGGAGFLISMLPVFVTQGWIVLRRKDWPLAWRIVLALISFPLLAGAIGLIVGWLQGYWNR